MKKNGNTKYYLGELQEIVEIMNKNVGMGQISNISFAMSGF